MFIGKAHPEFNPRDGSFRRDSPGLLALVTIMVILALDADHPLARRTLFNRWLALTKETKIVIHG